MGNNQNEKKVDYKNMAKKLLGALIAEINNLGYVDKKSKKGYLEENVDLDKEQVTQAIKWSRQN